MATSKVDTALNYTALKGNGRVGTSSLNTQSTIQFLVFKCNIKICTTAWLFQPLASNQVYLLIWQLLEHIHPVHPDCSRLRVQAVLLSASAKQTYQLGNKWTIQIADRSWVRIMMIWLCKCKTDSNQENAHMTVRQDTTLPWHRANKGAVYMYITINWSIIWH